MARGTRPAETADVRNARRKKQGKRSASRVSGIPELLEMILLRLPQTRVVGGNDYQPQLQLFALQRVNSSFYWTIAGSKKLQAAMTVPPLSHRVRRNRALVAFGDDYGPGFAKAFRRALASPQVFQGSWRRVRFNPNPEEPLKLVMIGSWIPWEQTRAETTWGDVVWWHHRGVPLRRPQCHVEDTIVLPGLKKA